MNRIANAIAKMEATIAENDVPQEKLDKLNTDLNLTFEEHFAYQNAQAAAHAGGKLSLEESQFIYQALGGSSGHFNKQPLVVKIVVHQTVRQLMNERLKMFLGRLISEHNLPTNGS